LKLIPDSTSKIQDTETKHREIIAWGQQIVLMACLKIYLICESIRKSYVLISKSYQNHTGATGVSRAIIATPEDH
jgi:hypothetical protein